MPLVAPVTRATFREFIGSGLPTHVVAIRWAIVARGSRAYFARSNDSRSPEAARVLGGHDKGSATESHPVPLLFVHGASRGVVLGFQPPSADKGYQQWLRGRGHGNSSTDKPLRSCSVADTVETHRLGGGQPAVAPVIMVTPWAASSSRNAWSPPPSGRRVDDIHAAAGILATWRWLRDYPQFQDRRDGPDVCPYINAPAAAPQVLLGLDPRVRRRNTRLCSRRTARVGIDC